jgi:flagellar export protein FliJ
VKKFDFPLARVAKWSEQQLTLEQVRLARLVQDLFDVDQRLRSLRQQASDSQSQLQGQATLSGGELVTLARFVKKLMEERGQLQKVRASVAERVEAQRQRVVAGHRKVKLFENLYRRRREEWTLALSQEEDALASDLHLARLAREFRTADTALEA